MPLGANKNYMINCLKEKIGNKRIIILGFGLEGQSTLKYLQKNRIQNEIVIADKNTDISNNPLVQELTLIYGDRYLSQIDKDDFVIKSPGIPLKRERPELKSHSQTSLFLEFYRNQIIGITGTKGKSTSSSMIYKILQEQGKKCILVGNIGQPAFNLIDDISEEVLIIYELSAHQLQCVELGPKMAILLNLMPEHLDFFINKELYYQAKLNIFNGQKNDDFSFYHEDVEQICNDLPEVNATHTILKEDILKYGEDYKIEKEDLQFLVGSHHLKNIQALIELVYFLELDVNKAIETIRNFHPLPHRQEYLGEKNGVIFINDSISTIPQSAIQAIKAVGQVDYLILGGLDRGVDYSDLADFLGTQNFKKVFFLGKAGKSILREIRENLIDIYFKFKWYEKLQEIREELLQIKSGTVLLSPAAASYDSFKNFEERGDYFRGIFEELAE